MGTGVQSRRSNLRTCAPHVFPPAVDLGARTEQSTRGLPVMSALAVVPVGRVRRPGAPAASPLSSRHHSLLSFVPHSPTGLRRELSLRSHLPATKSGGRANTPWTIRATSALADLGPMCESQPRLTIRHFALRQRWWIAAAASTFAMCGIGRALDPNWLYGNAEHCDTWFNLGEMVLMGEDASNLWPGLRQTARVADFFLGGSLYRIFDTEVAQFLTATLWLTVCVVAISAAARRIAGTRAYIIALTLSLIGWPLYTAVATDFVNRSITAWFAISLFGSALAVRRSFAGRALGIGAALTGTLINSTAIIVGASLGLLALLISSELPSGRRLHVLLSRSASLVTGLMGGAFLTISLGNLTGSAPGASALTTPLGATFDFISQGYLGKSSGYHVPLMDILNSSPLLTLLFLLATPGLAYLIGDGFRILRNMAAGIVVARPTSQLSRVANTIHATNIGALGLVLILQSRGGSWLSADFYIVWFVPLGILSVALASTLMLRVARDSVSLWLIGSIALAVTVVGVHSLWWAPWGFLGQNVLTGNLVAWTWIFIALLVIPLAARTLVAPIVVIALVGLTYGLTPSGYGATAWKDRGAPADSHYSSAELQVAAVEATRASAAVIGGGGVIWWVENSSDFLQSRLPRASIQCSPPTIQPDRLTAGGSAASGPFDEAPTSLQVFGADPGRSRTPATVTIPSGQGLMLVLPADNPTSPDEGLKTALRTLRASGLRPTIAERRPLPGNYTVTALHLRCPRGASECTLKYGEQRLTATG